MDEKTKKKRVEKRSIRKKKDLNAVSAKPATKKNAKKQPKLVASKKTEQSRDYLKPTLEQIRLRAYFISEQRRNAGITGDEDGDWLRAENELRSELSSSELA